MQLFLKKLFLICFALCLPWNSWAIYRPLDRLLNEDTLQIIGAGFPKLRALAFSSELSPYPFRESIAALLKHPKLREIGKHYRHFKETEDEITKIRPDIHLVDPREIPW